MATIQEIYQQSIDYLLEDKLVEAEAGFNFLLDRCPDNHEFLFYIGVVVMKRGFHAHAMEIFNLCAERDPNNIATWNNMGYIHKAENRDKEAVKTFRKAISLLNDNVSDDDKSSMWNNLATMYINNGTPHKGIEYCDKSIEFDDSNHFAHWNKGLALLELGQWTEGWKEYESGFKHDNKRKVKNYGDGLPCFLIYRNTVT